MALTSFIVTPFYWLMGDPLYFSYYFKNLNRLECLANEGY